MTMPDFSAGWDAALATLVPMLIGFFVVRTERFKAWRTGRKATREQLEAMASKWQGFESGIAKHFEDINTSRLRVTGQFQTITARLDAQDRALATILSMTMGQFDMSPVASFVCEGDGRNTNVNSAYAAMLGVGRDDLMEYRYKRFIPSEILTAHMALFAQAAHDHREFEDEIAMIRIDRTALRVRVHMIPYPREVGPATHWVGTLTVIQGATT